MKTAQMSRRMNKYIGLYSYDEIYSREKWMTTAIQIYSDEFQKRNILLSKKIVNQTIHNYFY